MGRRRSKKTKRSLLSLSLAAITDEKKKGNLERTSMVTAGSWSSSSEPRPSTPRATCDACARQKEAPDGVLPVVRNTIGVTPSSSHLVRTMNTLCLQYVLYGYHTGLYVRFVPVLYGDLVTKFERAARGVII